MSGDEIRELIKGLGGKKDFSIDYGGIPPLGKIPVTPNPYGLPDPTPLGLIPPNPNEGLTPLKLFGALWLNQALKGKKKKETIWQKKKHY